MTQGIQFKVENDRVLVPVGRACRFACKYCYTRSGEVGPPKVDAEDILRQFEVFARTASFEHIQFGYDGDPFDRPERGIRMLQQLASMGKNISFSTKAFIAHETLDALAAIHEKMAAAGNSFVAFVSLSCWDSAATVEPHTPIPQERMLSIKNLKSISIPTFIALRPILPNISHSEYEKLSEKGITVGCDGFVLGPLYADDRGQFVRFIQPEILQQIPSRKAVVSWSAHEPVWTRYEDETRLHKIAAMIEQMGGRVFTSSVDAIELAHNGGLFIDRNRTEMQTFS